MSESFVAMVQTSLKSKLTCCNIYIARATYKVAIKYEMQNKL